MTKINRHIIPAPTGYSLTSNSEPGELAEVLERLAARTGLAHFGRAARAISQQSPGRPPAFEALEDAAKRTGDRRYERALRELLKPSPGQRSPATERAIRQRDEAIRDMATFFPDCSQWAKCQKIHQLLLRYDATGWRRGDDRLEQMPARYLQTPYAGAFAVLQSGQPVPGPRQLQRILQS
ncbi:MAG: hypothetical protein EOQ98_30430 [Mesorhizobium sp.]|uniref:hypothetical protein n=1 Tax=Mesorhizobium sp. TaxID=1871066 RepID=UPI000FE8043A|nr:hypothetical protein [Mesorhizobium sp.]RWO94584.1 MAG: hypothetical protein EOQ98_30430 [Mesorhizobium sp.]